MTTLEALKATIEFSYTNDNLFTKVLADNGLAGTETYSTDYERLVDLACADVYLYLASHPDYKEGGQSVTYSKKALLNARKLLYRKYGIDPPELTNKPATINGERIW